MRILAVGAHPDDVEILCSGTLARYVAQGHQVTIAHATNGDKGHEEIPLAELGAVRRQEAVSAAEVIGAESVWGGLNDAEVYVNDETMRRMVELIRAAGPDLIITHHPGDYHGDHNAVTKLVVDGSFLAGVPYYKTAQPALKLTPFIYFMDVLAGIDFNPSEYVDITETFELKKQALSKHVSQITWGKEHHGTDFIDMIEVMARFRGLQCGVRYAEGFQRMRAWGRLSTTRQLP